MNSRKGDYGPRGTIRSCIEPKVAAAFWLGDMLRYGEATYQDLASQEDGDGSGERDSYYEAKYVTSKVSPQLRSQVYLTDLGFGHFQEVAPLPSVDQERWLHRDAKGGNGKPWPKKTLREEIKKECAQKAIDNTPLPTGKYDVIVIDPPWPTPNNEKSPCDTQS